MDARQHKRWMFQLGPTTVDVMGQRLLRKQVEIPLTDLEMRLLLCLRNSEGVPVEREALFDEVWGYNESVHSRALDSTVKRLRAKLEADPKRPQFLITERGVGYRLAYHRESGGLKPENASTLAYDPNRVPAAALEKALAGLLGPDPHDAVGDAVLSLRISKAMGQRKDARRLAAALERADTNLESEIWWRCEALWSLEPEQKEDEARTLIQRAEQCGVPALLCRALSVRLKGAAAQSRVARALGVAEEHELHALVPELQSSCAYFLNQRDPAQAHRLYLKAIVGAQQEEDAALVSKIELNYSTFLLSQGAVKEARRRLTSIVESPESDLPNRCFAWINLGVLEYETFRLEPSERAIREALKLAEEMNRADLVLLVRTNLLSFRWVRGDRITVEEAEACMRAAAAMDRPVTFVLTLHVMAGAWSLAGRTQLALIHLDQALEEFASWIPADLVGILRAERALLRLQESASEEGRRELEQAIDRMLGSGGRDASLYRYLEVWLERFDHRPDFQSVMEGIRRRYDLV